MWEAFFEILDTAKFLLRFSTPLTQGAFLSRAPMYSFQFFDVHLAYSKTSSGVHQ